MGHTYWTPSSVLLVTSLVVGFLSLILVLWGKADLTDYSSGKKAVMYETDWAGGCFTAFVGYIGMGVALLIMIAAVIVYVFFGN